MKRTVFTYTFFYPCNDLHVGKWLPLFVLVQSQNGWLLLFPDASVADVWLYLISVLHDQEDGPVNTISRG
jgi:hypothetical protein